MLVMYAELARDTKGPKVREDRVKRLSQTANRLVRPKFDTKLIRDALVASCVERPDFGDPVVLDEKNKIHLNGTFDLDELSAKYFSTKGVTINAE